MRSSSMSGAEISYRSTVMACYVANFVGALVVNLTPILFVPLKIALDLSYTQFGILVAVNYITQTAADIIFSYPADKYGCRPFIVMAPLLTILGYGIFALAPELSPGNPFPWLVVGTILFSATGGLLELLLNVIINGIPGEQKVTLMGLLHSFYAWGQLTVVLLTTLAVYLFGAENWQWIMAGWAFLPLINFVQFILCPLPPPVPEEKRQGAKILCREVGFYLIILTIVFAGMTEVSAAMWISTYLERAIEFPKIVGDCAGMCCFAIMLGVGRSLYAIHAQKLDVRKLMMAGSVLAILCYLTAALSGNMYLALVACALCGLAVSLLWPGSVILAGRLFPLAGAWLYAMLAAGGDTGAALGPGMIGFVVDYLPSLPGVQELLNSSGFTVEQFGLRAGMVVGAFFPAITLLLLMLFPRISSILKRTTEQQ